MMFPLKVIKKLSLITLVIIISLLGAFVSDAYAVSIFGENFNSLWSTTNPPVAPSGDTWTIAFTGDTSINDWHRKDAFTQPWQDNPTPYACLIGGQLTGDAPDSLISPVINCSSYYNIVFRCSTFFSPLGGSYRATIWGSIDSGQTWSYVIRNFTNQNIPAQLLTDNLPWATGETRVRFLWLFEGDPAALAQWSIDDFSLTGITVNDTDIATIRINRPRPFELPTPISIPLQATFMNVGRFTKPNIWVHCKIFDSNSNEILYVTDPIDSIINGDSIVHNFSVAANLDTGMYSTTVWCEASNDEEGSNDTLRKVFRVGWLEEQKYDDSLRVGDSSFVYERYGWGVKFYNHLYPDQPTFIQSVKFHFSLPLDTLSNKFRIRICDDDVGGGPGTPLYESRILRAVSDWNTFDISSDSIAIWDSSFYVFFIQVEGSPLSPKLSYDAARDTEALYWVCYDSIYVQDFTTGDWMIRCVLNYQIEYPRPNADDFRTVYIGSPEENIVVRPPGRTFIPSARIENWGDQPWIDVPVVCSIISLSSPTTPYFSQMTIDLNPTDDTILMFDPWLPDFRGLARITVRTLLPTDMDSTNDAKDETLYVHRSAFVGEDYSPYDYRWIDSDTTGGPVFSWIDTSGWYHRIAQGDDQTHAMPLIDSLVGGFSFRFYDTTYNTIWVSDNGWIKPGPDTGFAPPGNPNNVSLPDSMEPNNTIYAFWDDLAFGPLYGGGGIFFKKLGAAPNRKFVIIYQDVRRKNAPSSDPITFEVILHENGIITVQYKDVFCSDARYNNGRSASVGTDDSTGTYGLEYLYGEGGAGGYYPGNKINPGLAVNLYPFRKDVSLYRKVAPSKYSLPGDVTPRFRLINFGTTAITESFWTYLKIQRFGFTYLDSVQTTLTLYPGDSLLLTFQPITLTLGRYALICTTALLNDQINSNDFIAESIFVQSWAQRPDIPKSISRKRVKNGALTYFQTGKKIYGLKGSNDLEFFQYDIVTENWDTLTPLPDSNTQTGKRRKAKMGTALCYGDGNVYAIKGGNRQDFYAYNIIQDSWVERCTIPQQIRVGAGWVVLRKPKAGAALVFAPITGRVYLLIGNRTRFFLNYNPALNEWQLLNDIPIGYPPKKVKSGGAMTVGGDTIFALKGGSSNEFYGYILSRDTWVNLKSVPEGAANKRVKAGAALAYYQGKVYCFKGGNTTEWWIYYQQQDTWLPGAPIPFGSQRRKKVKRGSALVATDSLIFAFKGANTQEFWAYGPGFDSFVALPTSANGPSEEMVQKKITFGLWTYPNPAFNQVKIHYGVTQKTKIRIDVYNVLGERVKTLVNEEKPVGAYSLVWDGKADNGKQVSAGIYMAKIKQADKIKTNKLIITR